MKSRFDQIEANLQRLIESNLARIFAYEDVEDKLAERLAEAMRTGARTREGEICAPNHYTLAGHPDLAKALRANPEWQGKLEGWIYDCAAQAGIALAAQPSLQVQDDAALPNGEFTVQASWLEEELGETTGMQLDEKGEGGMPVGAFVIVDGKRVFPLDEGVINIGRSPENQLVIDDPRVSRLHAQMRAVRGQYLLFDLDSTGGTQVNGKAITHTLLNPGDVISLAGVTLIYGEENERVSGETEEYLSGGEDGYDLEGG